MEVPRGMELCRLFHEECVASRTVSGPRRSFINVEIVNLGLLATPLISFCKCGVSRRGLVGSGSTCKEDLGLSVRRRMTAHVSLHRCDVGSLVGSPRAQTGLRAGRVMGCCLRERKLLGRGRGCNTEA